MPRGGGAGYGRGGMMGGPARYVSRVLAFSASSFPHMWFRCISEESAAAGGEGGEHERQVFDGKRMRKPVVRKTVGMLRFYYLCVERPPATSSHLIAVCV